MALFRNVFIAFLVFEMLAASSPRRVEEIDAGEY
jgi:hypothetical protein